MHYAVQKKYTIFHYNHYDISMTALLSNIASLTIVCPLEHEQYLKDVTYVYNNNAKIVRGMIPCHILFVLILRTDASLIFRILHLIYQTRTHYSFSGHFKMPANTCFQISYRHSSHYDLRGHTTSPSTPLSGR